MRGAFSASRCCPRAPPQVVAWQRGRVVGSGCGWVAARAGCERLWCGSGYAPSRAVWTLRGRDGAVTTTCGPMGTASSKARDQQQRRRAQGVAVAQAEKRLEAGRRSPPGAVHRAIAPGTLSPIKTARSKSKPLAKRASEAMGCSRRRVAKKRAGLLPQPSSAGGLAVEVGGKQFVQAGEARRREAEAIRAKQEGAKQAEQTERAERQKAMSDLEAETEIREANCEGRCTPTGYESVVQEMAPKLPTPHRQPCANDPAWLRRPTPLAAKPSKEDENRGSVSATEAGPRTLLAPRRLGPLAPLTDHHLSRTPRLKKLPAPRGRRHQHANTAVAPPSGLPLTSDPQGTSKQSAPPVPSIGWAQTEQ